MWVCLTPERAVKTARILGPLLLGWKEPIEVVLGAPPDDDEPFIVWGQKWLSLDIIPLALARGRKFWLVDNGYFDPAKGEVLGYYRVTYCGVSPILMERPDFGRGAMWAKEMRPWRRAGRNVVLALPGETFGRCVGMDVAAWTAQIEELLPRLTKRQIVVRPKFGALRSLGVDLNNAHALVTHSSNVAVDAVMKGVPVFVQPSSPAAPVGATHLDLERPERPDRQHWLASLASQQFTVSEFADGTAYHFMKMVQEQVDGLHLQSRSVNVA